MFEAPRQVTSAVAAQGDVAIGFAPVAPIDFSKIWSVLWRGKATILATTAAALVMALLLVLIVPHKFTATTQLLIDPSDLRAVANELTPATQLSDAALLQVESQVRVLTSDTVLRRVVAAENLERDPEFYRGPSLLRVFANGLLAKFGVARPAVADPLLAALTELRRRVSVKRAERTYVVDVSVTSKDPEMAARLANAVAQAYLAEQTQVRSDAARQVSQSLSGRLKELQDRVREAEQRVEAFKARNNIVGANGQLVNEQQLGDLNNQLSLARVRTSEAKARLEQVEVAQKSKGDIGAFPEALQSATITQLRSQYAEVMRREAEQMISLGSRHPAVIEIEAQAARLHRMIEDEVERIARSSHAEYESAKASEESLSRSLETLKRTAITTNEALVGLRELERDVQASRAVYEAFLVRARETGEQEQIDTKNIRVISRADLPLSRSSPPSNLIVALAAIILGMAAGSGIVIIRAPVGDRAPRGGQPPAPRVETREAVKAPPPPPPDAELASGVPVLAVLPAGDVSFGLEAVEDPKSKLAMEVRKVLAALRASAPKSGSAKSGSASILVVAADDEDDTAAVALTLAAAAAATQRVLLIDADLERRTLSAIDADGGEAGLVDVAVGRRLLSDAIVRDRDTNINLISFVSPQSRRDRRISDADVKQAFDQTKRFDMVIVAAMGLAGDPGTRFFAGLVDHIVLVARAGEPVGALVEKFTSRLGLDARKIRGAVLTAEAA